MPILSHLRAVALATGLSSTAAAAVTVDVDCGRLRQSPDAEAIRSLVQAQLSEQARGRIEALEKATGFRATRDLERIVVLVPDEGPATLTLVGVPAEALGRQLALRSRPETLCGGTGYQLPERERTGLAVVAADTVVLGRLEDLRQLNAAPALPAPSASPVLVQATPRAEPRSPAGRLLRQAVFTSDGTGQLTLRLQARDSGSADQVVTRYELVRKAAELGMLPDGLRAVVAASSLEREGESVVLQASISSEQRARLLVELMRRAKARGIIPGQG